MIVKIICYVLGALVLILAAYVTYVFITYYRLDDTLPLEAEGEAQKTAETGVLYTITTFNIGFGAYSSDYSFFMDGGEHAWALSLEEAVGNIKGTADLIAGAQPDFAFFQEVDTDSTRSYHVDQLKLLTDAFTGYTSVFAQNYDSPFLMYPLLQPIGKSQSGIVTLSEFLVTEATRRSLPIEEGFRKLLDLDRCYSVTRVPVSDSAQLVLINVHLSAYTKDEAIGNAQLQVIFEEAEHEYNAGHYVIIGGDFNKNLQNSTPLTDEGESETFSWAMPLDSTLLPEGFTLLQPENETDVIPTVRDSKEGYIEGVTFVSVIDGFIVSDNITPIHEEHIDADFTYSDHNPVLLQFILGTNTCTGGACGKYGSPGS